MSTAYTAAIRKLETSNRTRRRALGVYQIFGGVIGLVSASFVLAEVLSEAYALIFVVAFIVALYLFSIFCGIQLLRNKESALSYSMAHQIAQTVSFSLGSFGWMYASGVHFSVGMDLTRTQASVFTFNFGVSSFNASIGGEPGLHSLFFNAVAIYFIYYIAELRRNIQKEALLKNAEEFGNEPAGSNA